jgi:hypothetical protein
MFKRWAIGFVGYLFFLYYMFEISMFSKLWEADVSKLSFVIILMFTIELVTYGLNLRSYERNGVTTDLELKEGYDKASLLEKIGMMGTIIGFIVMLYSLKGVDLTDTANIADVFSLATTGMSTALFTTLAGLVTGTALELLYKRFEKTAAEEIAIVKVK